MQSFQEFLAEQAEKLPSEQSKATEKRDEWIAAVDRFNQDVKTWLEQDDPERLLTIEERTYELREEGIGTYRVPGLLIGLGPREVRLEPIARFVAGPLSSSGIIHIPRAYGRIDLTNRLKKYMIFRTDLKLEGPWKMIEQDGYVLRPLAREPFEEALQRLLE